MYKDLTEDKLRQAIEDTMYGKPKSDSKLVIYAFGYEDENGNIRCGFMEEFDKAMKEHIKSLKDG